MGNFFFRFYRKEIKDINISELFTAETGIILHVNNMFLCPDFIKNTLQPDEFDYKYDWLDTFESGFFVKDNIHVKIEWSIYTDYDFTIDKYSTKEQIEKTKKWVEQIFNFLIANEEVEKRYIDVNSFECEEIIPLDKE